MNIVLDKWRYRFTDILYLFVTIVPLNYCPQI